VSRCALLEFGRKAGRAGVKNRIVVLERWYSMDVLVRMVEIVVTTVGKALVPEKAISAHRELVQVEFALERSWSRIGGE
jgi:hypothetical protein